jgi:iron complex transport system substrate-binding protein
MLPLLRFWLALLGLTLAVVGAPLRAEVVVRDDLGAELRLPAPPQRIVSMMPSLTESLCTLGACARLVGVDRYANWPAQVARLPRLGGLDDALIEAIVALRPDVVLGASSARVLDRLQTLGIPVLRLKSDSHADVRRSLAVLAALLGTPQQGDRLWADIERGLDQAAARLPARLRGQRVYVEIGGGPYAAGARSFIGETLTRLGLGNIVPDTMGPFPKLNPEFVLRAQPDIVIAQARDTVAMAGRPGWGQLVALQRQRVCPLDTPRYELLTRPGPRLAEAAAVLADCLAGLPPAASLPSAGLAGGKP